MNFRSFTRVRFESMAVIRYEGKPIKGEVQNLSMNGLFLKTDKKIPIGEPVDVKILLSGSSSRLTLNIRAVIVRHDSEGMGVQFSGMYLDSFNYLKNIIERSLEDETKVMSEFLTFMNKR